MSLDDLLPGLLFFLFVVMPIIGRLRKGGGTSTGTPTGQPAPRPPAQPGQPAARPGQATARPTAQQMSSPPSQGPVLMHPLDEEDERAAPPMDPEAELLRRLAEARERVRRAMASAGGSASGSPAQPVLPPPAAARAPATLVSRPASTVGGGVSPEQRRHAPLVRDRDDGLLSTPLEPTGQRQAPTPRPSGRRAPPRRDRGRAEQTGELQLEVIGRPQQERGGRLLGGQGRPIWLEPENIRQGFIWHQVLGESKARRRMRGGPSPRR